MNWWPWIAGAWSIASVVALLYLARVLSHGDYERHVHSALGLLRDDCACGSQNRRRSEQWAHSPDGCYPAREWIGS